MKITYTFVLKNQINKDGSQSILFRIIFNREIIYINTGIRTFKKYWDTKNLEIKDVHPFANDQNIQLQSYPAKLNRLISLRTVNDDTVKIEDLKNLYHIKIALPKTRKTNNFIEYVEKNIETEGKQRLRPESLRLHKCRIKLLKEYCPVLYFDQINREFLLNYEDHLRNVLKNHPNTIHGKLKFIRTYINKAIRDGIIDKYIFKSYKLKQVRTKPKYLSYDDFLKLEKYYAETQVSLHKKHLQYFLFSCTTGLRYSDLKCIKWEDIKDNWIYIKMQKTCEPVCIPITKTVEKYLPEPKESGIIFNVPENQVANRFLKEIAAKAEVDQNISTHVARHTFATICLNKDISLPVVQRLLGHSSIRTTEIYAKIIDSKLKEEMSKWDNN